MPGFDRSGAKKGGEGIAAVEIGCGFVGYLLADIEEGGGVFAFIGAWREGFDGAKVGF